VIVAVCADETDAIFAWNPAVDWLLLTVDVLGTVTAELLLERFTTALPDVFPVR
jgi:hypothetical protein